MLSDQPVLIVQDNIYLALDLAAEVERLAGRVIGPASTVHEALTLLEKERVAAALIDADSSGDVAPLVKVLAERRLPYVIEASGSVAPAITMAEPTAPVLIKPIRPLDVVSRLAHELMNRELP